LPWRRENLGSLQSNIAIADEKLFRTNQLEAAWAYGRDMSILSAKSLAKIV